MLEERLQEKINKYPQPENCEGLTKVRVNQLIWDNLNSTIGSQDLKFQKVQTSVVKGMTALARVTDAILKRVNEINGGKVLAQEAIDSLSLLAHANTELNNRRKELIKPDLHTDYKHLCSASRSRIGLGLGLPHNAPARSTATVLGSGLGSGLGFRI